MASQDGYVDLDYLERLLDLLIAKGLMHVKIEGVGELVFPPKPQQAALVKPGVDDAGRLSGGASRPGLADLFHDKKLPQFPKRPDGVDTNAVKAREQGEF